MGWQNYGYYPAARPAPKALPGMERKVFGETWWGKKFVSGLETSGNGSRLQRGRAYAKAGRVKGVSISEGKITAKVSGSSTYSVSIELPIFSYAEWKKAIEKMSEGAEHSAKLLCGEMPPAIEGVFAAMRHPLFPQSFKEMDMECSCPDFETPCKHIAAVLYVVADSFDHDPFLIFRLRGMERDTLLKEIRNFKGEHAEMQEIPAAETHDSRKADEILNVNEFWEMGKNAENMQFSLSPPLTPAIIPKRLRKPKFWASRHNFEKIMETVYSAISENAGKIARGTDGTG